MTLIERLEALVGQMSAVMATNAVLRHEDADQIYKELRAIIAEIKKQNEAVRKVAEEMEIGGKADQPRAAFNLPQYHNAVIQWAARLREAVDE